MVDRLLVVAALVVLLGACESRPTNYWIPPDPHISPAQGAADNDACLRQTEEKYPEFQAIDFVPVVGLAAGLNRLSAGERFYFDCMAAKGYVRITVAQKEQLEKAKPQWVILGLDGNALMTIRAGCQRTAATEVRDLNLPTGSAGIEYERRVAACMLSKGAEIWTDSEVKAYQAASGEAREAIAACMAKVVDALPIELNKPFDPEPRWRLRDACLIEMGQKATTDAQAKSTSDRTSTP